MKHQQRHQNNNPHCSSCFKLNEYECRKLDSFRIGCCSSHSFHVHVCLCVCASFLLIRIEQSSIFPLLVVCVSLFQLTSFSLFLWLELAATAAAVAVTASIPIESKRLKIGSCPHVVNDIICCCAPLRFHFGLTCSCPIPCTFISLCEHLMLHVRLAQHTCKRCDTHLHSRLNFFRNIIKRAQHLCIALFSCVLCISVFFRSLGYFVLLFRTQTHAANWQVSIAIYELHSFLHFVGEFKCV